MKFFTTRSLFISFVSSAAIFLPSSSFAAPVGWVEQCMNDLIDADGDLAQHKDEVKSYCGCVAGKLGGAKTSYAIFLTTDAGDKAHAACSEDEEESAPSAPKAPAKEPSAKAAAAVPAEPSDSNDWVSGCVKDLKLAAGEGEKLCACLYEGSEKPTSNVKTFVKTKNGFTKRSMCEDKLGKK